MNDREFYDLCYEEYKREVDQTDALYQRAGVLLTALPILGAVVYGLGRTDLLELLFGRLDVFLYYLATAGALVCLAVSTWYTVLSLYPRKYQTLAAMKKWQCWRDDYRKTIMAQNPQPGGDSETVVGSEMLRSMIPLLTDAQQGNARINETRRQQFQRAVRWGAFAIVGIAFEALLCLVLHLEKVKPT